MSNNKHALAGVKTKTLTPFFQCVGETPTVFEGCRQQDRQHTQGMVFLV